MGNKKINWFVVLLLTVFFVPQSFSQEKSSEVLYLDGAFMKPELILPPPPQKDSEQFKFEIETIKKSVAKLNEAQRELATKDALNQTVSFFADVLPGFDLNKLPQTASLFNSVKYNAGYESKIFKDYFATKRPYQEDSDILACVPPTNKDLNRSYPSGHTTMGYAMGIVLANLIPEKSKEIMLRAHLYGENRVNCGAHFPSDVGGGQVLGSLVAMELLKNNDFKELMRASKDELAQAGLTKP